MLQILSVITSVVVTIAGYALLVYLYRGFMPVLEIRLIPRWADEAERTLYIRLEVHNKSKVGLMRDPSNPKQNARFQILEYEKFQHGLLSEFVPFDETDVLSSERPIEWHEPIEVLKSTKKVEPGETVAVELMYRFNNPVGVHCGFQFRAKLNRVARLAYGKKTDSWTTTMWIIPAGMSNS